ncbi:SLAC1 family transporter [Noviherbaspirillum aerium]|uniref:SLAC1 family transporter n=1 Tax=Noviherbaspirillum aerium TaxID=2588497 RepID=UPI001CEF78DE|nr:hypothetical protein [Noviherbaspirillum aerium]
MNNDPHHARLYYLFGPNNTPQRGSWLSRFPAGIFAISVGLFGLVAAWRRAAASGWSGAATISEMILYLALTIWVISTLLYALKCKRHAQAVLDEFRHPVQGSLQSLIPLSALLAVILLQHPEQGIWLLCCIGALLLNGLIAGRTIYLLATGQLPRNAVTPALYLPVVGGFLVGAMALAVLHYDECAALLFSTGLSGWAILEMRVLGQLFEGPMPEPLRATIGIELAPPAVATLSAATLWPSLPSQAIMLGIGLTVIPFVSVFARYRWWSRIPFAIGFWSFSFPVAAFASVVLEASQRGGWPSWIGMLALFAATAVIAWLLLRTAILLVRGRLLP